MIKSSIISLVDFFYSNALKISLAGLSCYHVSLKEYDVGKTYSAQTPNRKVNPIGLELEKILEETRSAYFPNKPSRLRGFFCSPFKRSHWLYPNVNSFLYEVETADNFHIGDISLIDDISRTSDNDYRIDKAKEYWGGKTTQHENIEIITPSIKILGVQANQLKTKSFRMKQDLVCDECYNDPEYSAFGGKIYKDDSFDLDQRNELGSVYKNDRDENPITKPRVHNYITANRTLCEHLKKRIVVDIMSKRFELCEPV